MQQLGRGKRRNQKRFQLFASGPDGFQLATLMEKGLDLDEAGRRRALTSKLKVVRTPTSILRHPVLISIKEAVPPSAHASAKHNAIRVSKGAPSISGAREIRSTK